MASRIEGLAPTAPERSALIGIPVDADCVQSLDGAPRLFSLVADEPLVERVQPPVLAPRDPLAFALQRCLDVTIATACLIILSPVMLLAALLVRISGPGPVFYSHPRFGLDGKVFGCLKFRTMKRDADRLLQELLNSSSAIDAEWQRERKLRDDPRTTAIGRFLRRYSVDELPQLINVLRGEMSIVGPRPLPTTDAHYYAELFAVYCSVRPGITGLWQVSGRNDVCYSRRVELDCQYARTRSIRGDIWIILRTVPVVLRGTGY